MSTGLALKAMVLNAVTGRDPLYRLRSWAQELPLELLLGASVDAGALFFLSDVGRCALGEGERNHRASR